MKSKTSSFNMTIFRKNLTHYWPIWVVYLCYLIMVVPVSIGLIYANVENNYIGNMPFEHKQVSPIPHLTAWNQQHSTVYVQTAYFQYNYFQHSHKSIRC